MDDRFQVCLCPRCRQQFQDAGGYRLRRVIFPQDSKDICTYCQTRYGYDYYLEPLVKAEELEGGEYDSCI